MKILFITPDLRYGGTNSSLSNIYDMIKNEYDIDVYSLYNNQIGDYSFRERILDSGKLIYLYYSYFVDLKGLDRVFAFVMKIFSHLCLFLKIDLESFLQKREVKRICGQVQYDLVVGFQEGSATKFASRFAGFKKMAWIHCDYARYYSLSGKDERGIYEKFDRIVCVSKFTAKSFKSIYPQLSEKVISIYNLYDKERVLKLAKEKIQEVRFDDSTFTILSVGRIDKVKRFSEIPVIAKKLKNLGKIFKWYIIGNVVEKDEYIRLCDNIKKNGIGNDVVLLGGKSNPYPYFSKCNLFVTTSSSEACPIVFLEAQTFNVPIVTTDFGSAREFIEYGRNGYISTIDKLYSCISDVIDGNLDYQPKESINNEIVVNQLNEEIYGLLSKD